MRSLSSWPLLAGAFVIVAVAPGAGGAVLIFDPLIADGGEVLQAYGDRITAPTQFGFQYGTTYGFTPNVILTYFPTLRYRGSGYGDLTNVLFRENSGDRVMLIAIAADQGHTVGLHSFDLAAQLGEDLTVPFVQVLDGGLNVLYTATQVALEGDFPTHTHFQFDPPLQAGVILIRIDLQPLVSKCTRVAIDNIGISQDFNVPSPGGYVLVGCAGAVVAVRRRRRVG